jgi:hypothetical protein
VTDYDCSLSDMRTRAATATPPASAARKREPRSVRSPEHTTGTPGQEPSLRRSKAGLLSRCLSPSGLRLKDEPPTL